MSDDSRPVQPTNEELAQRSQHGCCASFEELVRRLQVPLVQFLTHRTATFADAEDLAQEAFVRAYQNLHRYRGPWRFSTWLFTIARRLALNEGRRSPVTTGSAALALAQADIAEPIELLHDEESSRSLWGMARRVLTEEQFTATWLFYVEEQPIKEIAQVLDRSRVAVKAILFRARKRLLPYLESRVNLNEPGPSDSAPPNTAASQKTVEASHV